MKQNTVRIIAGKWRGRRLQVLDLPGLRPTPDRVRETLFNWLAPVLPGARCLDLFSGTGILGFEALSRGATYVAMVDQSAAVVKLLQENLQTFKAEGGSVYQAVIPEALPAVIKPIDIVFIDPPYQANLLLPTCHYLEAHDFLANTALIYLEAPHMIKDNELPATWQIIKCKQAGQVFYHLAKREQSA